MVIEEFPEPRILSYTQVRGVLHYCKAIKVIPIYDEREDAFPAQEAVTSRTASHLILTSTTLNLLSLKQKRTYLHRELKCRIFEASSLRREAVKAQIQNPHQNHLRLCLLEQNDPRRNESSKVGIAI